MALPQPFFDPTHTAAWLVDLDGTLYHARYLKLAMAVELGLLGVWNVPVLRRFRHEHEQLRLDQTISDGPYATQLERTAKATGCTLAEIERITSTWMIERPRKWVRLFRRRSLISALERYRALGGRCALVSDYPATRKLDALGCGHLFDVVVANGEAGGPPALKPRPDGYLRAAESLGVPPARCLVIGDRPDADGEAARAAGMEFFRI